MSLRFRLIFTFSLLVGLGFLGIARWVQGELRNSYGQVVEESLVDFSHFMASQLESQNLTAASLASLETTFGNYKARVVSAKIFDYVKTTGTLDLYVTDSKGLVVFSSRPRDIGKDFSQWNDVLKTLRGEYGARSTRQVSHDSRTSVFHVAAPIRIDQQIKGVVTIIKTESSILVFLDRALQNVFRGGLLAMAGIGVLAILSMLWITTPLERLRKYALAVSQGLRPDVPESSIPDIRSLTDAFEKMRVALQGKKTVEKYTQILTHELKSPLTAIKGAAELCLEEMDHQQRSTFLQNIIKESNRSHQLLEQLLKIAALEARGKIQNPVRVGLRELAVETIEALSGLWRPRAIEIQVNDSAVAVNGDPVLLFQMLRNLLQNAIDFSPNGSRINLDLASDADYVKIEIIDEGAGIPAYALGRVFEKFYSLERPNSQVRSSGLGLSFVKEVVELHGGSIQLESPVKDNKGTRVVIRLKLLN